MENKVLTKEEIQTLTELKEKYNKLVIVLGETEAQIMDLKLRKEQIKSLCFQKRLFRLLTK